MPRARQRALLALLALYGDQPVTSASLADMMWGQYPPMDWQGALRTHVWQIRRSLPEPRLDHNSSGYRLRATASELDLAEFRQLDASGRHTLAQGDHRSAAALLGQAVLLWRDPPLADLPDTPTTTAIVRRLLEERRAAEAELADVRLELGEHRAMLAELWARVAEGDGDERVWERLMIALYRCGMRAAALQAFSEARKMLADDYGIDPGPGLRRLHHQILCDDPVLNLWHADPGRRSG
jgi:DNA-binding SARP family transcriptional activator